MKYKESLQTHLEKFKVLREKDITAIYQNIETKTFKKGDFLIREGDVCQVIFFIKSGILRSYFTKPNGDEVTYCLTFGNNLMTALSSYLNEQATHENLQALTKLEVEVIEKKVLNSITQDNIHWQLLEKQLIAEQYIELEKRMLSIQRLSAKERYDELLAEHAQLLQYIPLKHLASFLNVTPRHLTRIRNAK